MTTRMTVAIAVLTLGLALAALAGIPALIENRTVGDVVVIFGFAVAFVGLVLVVAAVPGQRGETGKLRANDAIEIEKLGADRRRLASIAGQTERALRAAESRLNMANTAVGALLSSASTPNPATEVATLTTALIELEAALEVNAAEFKRYGVENPDDVRAITGRRNGWFRKRSPRPSAR